MLSTGLEKLKASNFFLPSAHPNINRQPGISDRIVNNAQTYYLNYMLIIIIIQFLFIFVLLYLVIKVIKQLKDQEEIKNQIFEYLTSQSIKRRNNVSQNKINKELMLIPKEEKERKRKKAKIGNLKGSCEDQCKNMDSVCFDGKKFKFSDEGQMGASNNSKKIQKKGKKDTNACKVSKGSTKRISKANTFIKYSIFREDSLIYKEKVQVPEQQNLKNEESTRLVNAQNLSVVRIFLC